MTILDKAEKEVNRQIEFLRSGDSGGIASALYGYIFDSDMETRHHQGTCFGYLEARTRESLSMTTLPLYYYVLPKVYEKGKKAPFNYHNSDYNYVVDFILKYDPWQIKEGLITQDREWIINNTWVFDLNKTKSDNLFGFSMFISRFMFDHNLKYKYWRFLQKKYPDRDPRQTLLLSQSIHGPQSEWLFDDPSMKFRVAGGPAWLEGLFTRFVYRWSNSLPKQLRSYRFDIKDWHVIRASNLFKEDDFGEPARSRFPNLHDGADLETLWSVFDLYYKEQQERIG